MGKYMKANNKKIPLENPATFYLPGNGQRHCTILTRLLFELFSALSLLQSYL